MVGGIGHEIVNPIWMVQAAGENLNKELVDHELSYWRYWMTHLELNKSEAALANDLRGWRILSNKMKKQLLV